MKLSVTMSLAQLLCVSYDTYSQNWIMRCPFSIQCVLTTQLNHLASLAKWSSVRLRTKWLWVGIPLLSLKLQIWRLLRTRSSLTFMQTIERRFILKLVRDMITTYSQMHRKDKHSQHSSVNWPVWLNG